jgi:hypothetical protein
MKITKDFISQLMSRRFSKKQKAVIKDLADQAIDNDTIEVIVVRVKPCGPGFWTGKSAAPRLEIDRIRPKRASMVSSPLCEVKLMNSAERLLLEKYFDVSDHLDYELELMDDEIARCRAEQRRKAAATK